MHQPDQVTDLWRFVYRALYVRASPTQSAESTPRCPQNTQTQLHVSDWSAGLPADVCVSILCGVVSDKRAPRADELPNLYNDRKLDFRSMAGGPCTASQAQAHRLLLVCRRFRDTIQQAELLSRTVVLGPDLNTQTCHSLQLWLQRNGASVRQLAAFSSRPQLNPALTAVLQAAPRLAEVLVTDCCTQTVQRLSSLSRVTVCELESLTEVNLDALQTLKSLHTLRLLHGSFEAEQLPCHLTALGLHQASMTTDTDCECVTSLKNLSLVHSYLDGLHEQGLPACLNVESVHCCFGTIRAGYDESFCTDHDCYLMTAEHLSALTCMKDLSLTFRWCTHHVMDISPLYALTSLESFPVNVVSYPFSLVLHLLHSMGCHSFICQQCQAGFFCLMSHGNACLHCKA